MQAHSVGDWEVVARFYSALHYLQEALLLDPVWPDAARLAGIDGRLKAKHKYVSNHQGHDRADGTREFGLQELTALLYPAVAVEFGALYASSVTVRYGRGIYHPSFLPNLRKYAQDVEDAAHAGLLHA